MEVGLPNLRWYPALGNKAWSIPYVIEEQFKMLSFKENPVSAYAFLNFFHVLKDPESVEKAQKVQQFLKEKHTYLFSQVIIQMGGMERTIPKGDLMAQSSKFEAMFQEGWNEGRNNLIVFPIPMGMEDSIAGAFLDFLVTGNIDFNDGEIAVPLAVLGRDNQIPLLFEACMAFIEVHKHDYDIYELLEIGVRYRIQEILNITKEILIQSNEISIETLFKMALEYDNYSPVQYCLENIIKNDAFHLIEKFIQESFKYENANLKWYGLMLSYVMFSGYLFTFVDFETTHDKFVVVRTYMHQKMNHENPIIRIAALCHKHRIEPSFSLLGKRKLQFSDINDETILVRYELNRNLNVESLHLNGFDDRKLELVASVISGPVVLELYNCKITKIPENWSNCLKRVYMAGVLELTELKLPNADSVETFRGRSGIRLETNESCNVKGSFILLRSPH